MFGGSSIDAGVLVGELGLDLRTEDPVPFLLGQDRLLLGIAFARPGEFAALAAVALDRRPGQGEPHADNRQQPSPVGANEGEGGGDGCHGLLSRPDGSVLRLY